MNALIILHRETPHRSVVGRQPTATRNDMNSETQMHFSANRLTIAVRCREWRRADSGGSTRTRREQPARFSAPESAEQDSEDGAALVIPTRFETKSIALPVMNRTTIAGSTSTGTSRAQASVAAGGSRVVARASRGAFARWPGSTRTGLAACEDAADVAPRRRVVQTPAGDCSDAVIPEKAKPSRRQPLPTNQPLMRR